MSIKKQLNKIVNEDVFVEGYLHTAPHRAFRNPTMVSPDTKSPFVKNKMNNKAVPVKMVLAYPIYSSGGIYRIVLDSGDLSVAKIPYRYLNWIKPILVYPESKSDTEDINWLIHDLKEGLL